MYNLQTAMNRKACVIDIKLHIPFFRPFPANQLVEGHQLTIPFNILDVVK